MKGNLLEYMDVDDDVNAYVVGDIHGCYKLLLQELDRIGFDKKRDILLGVGDLVDRGPENEECVMLLDQPWFKTTRGNHEQFCIEGYMDYGIEFYHKMKQNGGGWFYNLNFDLQRYIAEKFLKLPIAMEVRYKGKTYGLVHANLPVEDWELFKELLLNDDIFNDRSVVQSAMWDRDTSKKGQVEIAFVDRVYFGHTVFPEVTTVGNCTFIDTGSVFSRKLSIVKLGEDKAL